MPVQPLEEIEIYIRAEEIADKWWEIPSPGRHLLRTRSVNN